MDIFDYYFLFFVSEKLLLLNPQWIQMCFDLILIQPVRIEEYFSHFTKIRNMYTYTRGVVPGGAGQILADQLTLSQSGGTDYALLITTGTPGFSDLPTALYTTVVQCSAMQVWETQYQNLRHHPNHHQKKGMFQFLEAWSGAMGVICMTRVRVGTFILHDACSLGRAASSPLHIGAKSF